MKRFLQSLLAFVLLVLGICMIGDSIRTAHVDPMVVGISEMIIGLLMAITGIVIAVDL